MKKLPLLNREVSRAIADLGHRDLLVLADAGHAIPRGADRIDLALRPGQPPMIDVLETVLTELRVEAFIVCREMEIESPGLLEAYARVLPDAERVVVEYAEFRQLVESAKSVIRTGECSPFANVILMATGTV
jgi:D-ribose pyranase